MLSAGVPPTSPMPVEGGGSWVWVLVAIGMVVGCWHCCGWHASGGHDGRVDEEAPEVPSFQERKAA